MSVCPKCRTSVSYGNQRRKHRCPACRSWITDTGELYQRKIPDKSKDYDCGTCGRRLRPAPDFHGVTKPHNVRMDESTGGVHECMGEDDKPQPRLVSGG